MSSSSEMKLVMTVIGFAVSTLFIVFVCTRLICARIHLRAARRSFLVSSGSHLSTVERGLHGLDVPVLANFPAKRFSDDYFSSLENAQCAVCLAEYRKEDVLRILPQCGHYFHINCIDIWLLQNCTCPVCRVSLRETNVKKKGSMQPLFSSRSNYSMDPSSVHTYQCLLSACRSPSPSSSQGDRRANPHQGDRSTTRDGVEEIGTTMSPLGESCVFKHVGNEHADSPPCA